MSLPEVERQRAVLSVLQNLRGTESLKKLFWTELNYDKVNSPLPRKGWSEQAATALADDPVLFATGGKDFHVIHARLKADRPLMGMERPVVSRLLQDHPYALFIFSNASQDQWHFLNVKYDDDVQKRRVFRRITIGPEERLRTASERMAMLDLQSINPELFGLSPLTIQHRHDEAFDVEPVTEEFFREYHRVFEEVEGRIRGIRDAERKRLFAQRLFNRLMFVAFIQKKGWLKFDGNHDYLWALWNAHLKEEQAEKNFYLDRLKPLFFLGLNTSDEISKVDINRGGFLKTLIGEVRYLNGGLFEEDEDDKNSDIIVPDKATHAILDDLFNRFNFTVTESTPLDVEVAVDPEMLGKIFEELVTGRHETGSYYTPKPIVSFMCREALKGYLETQLPSESKTAIEQFVDEHKLAGIHDAEAVLDGLRRIKVCDPACGSGAYLLGMLHELLELRAALFATKRVDALSVYERKLEIIQRNLYGVDIDPFAINVAHLRLWLSLAVEFEGQNPPPLPNLDYKVETGDSLAAPDPSKDANRQDLLRKGSIEQFLALKRQYLTAHGSQKVELRKAIEKAREDIATWAHGNGSVQGFDWPVEFAEAFLDGGFDVVLANPPYVRMELFKDIKPMLRKNFPHVHSDRADLYCYFYARAVELLRHSGMLAFISSNKWFRAKYGANLRGFLNQNCEILTITDFGELPVFKAATFPMIFVAQKEKRTSQSPVFTQVRSLQPPYPDVLSLIKQEGLAVPAGAINGKEWRLSVGNVASLLEKLRDCGTPLREYAKGLIFYGIKSGLNRAFIINSADRKQMIAENPRCKNAIKRFLVGDNIRKWRVNWNDTYILYMYHGIDPAGLEPILKHLKASKSDLERRATKQEWYELQQPQYRYAQSFEEPKIVFPDIAKSPRFTLDSLSSFVDTTGFVIPLKDLYLLGVLNSKCVWRFLAETAAVLGDPAKGGRLRLKRMYVESIPIPPASDRDRTTIALLVQKCLEANGVDCERYEEQIEAKVAALFDVDLGDL